MNSRWVCTEATKPLRLSRFSSPSAPQGSFLLFLLTFTFTFTFTLHY